MAAARDGDAGPACSDAAVPVAGVELAATTAGFKESGRADLALVRLAAGSRTAAVFTRNAFRAAPVEVAAAHLAETEPAVLLVNSGCANAGSGRGGLEDARASCASAARACGVADDAVLPFSTGVIGPRLSDRVAPDVLDAAIGRAAQQVAPDGWAAAAEAIRTTDTHAKLASCTVELSGGVVRVTGMAKGSGMIRPDMATMLAFVATDAAVEPDALDALLRRAVDASFHRITVDGDTSTNDAVTLSATGASGAAVAGEEDLRRLGEAVTGVCVRLAQAIVRDAEGATRFVEIAVEGGRDERECRDVAFTVAHSPLVKTALHGGDPNWGRILAAVGRAPVEDLDIAGVDIALGDVPVVAAGQPVPGLDEARAAASVGGPEVSIRIGLGRGPVSTAVWTSDLSYEYVRINADYRT